EMDPHFRPQVLNTLIGHVRYDAVGHLEQFDELRARLPVDIPAQKRKSTGAWEQCRSLVSDRDIEKIAAIYKDDFTAFGYASDPAIQDSLSNKVSAAGDDLAFDMISLANPDKRGNALGVFGALYTRRAHGPDLSLLRPGERVALIRAGQFL